MVKTTLIALSVIVLLLFAVDNFAGSVPAGCSDYSVKEIPSPNPLLSGFLVDEYCTDGALTADMSTQVVIATKKGRLKDGEIVLSVDTNGDSHQKPKVEWLTASEIRLTIPDISLIGIRKATSHGIKVTTHFVPDRPEDRREMLKNSGKTSKEDFERYELSPP
jgi:hypothetical protein